MAVFLALSLLKVNTGNALRRSDINQFGTG